VGLHLTAFSMQRQQHVQRSEQMLQHQWAAMPAKISLLANTVHTSAMPAQCGTIFEQLL